MVTASAPASVDGRSVRQAAASPRSHSLGGAYGLRVNGVDVPPRQLIDAPLHWPSIELRVHVAPASPPGLEHVANGSARLNVRAGGDVAMDRAARRATFTLPAAPTPAALLHPHLAVVGAVWAHWRGREGFHAGAFVTEAGVWGLLG